MGVGAVSVRFYVAEAWSAFVRAGRRLRNGSAIPLQLSTGNVEEPNP